MGHRIEREQGDEQLRRARASAREVGRVLEGAPPGPRGEGQRWRAAIAGLGVTYRWSRQAFARAYERGDDRSFRAWRMAVKYHTLHVRLLAARWPGELNGRLEVLQRLGELLAQDQALSVFAEGTELRSLVDQRHQGLRALARPLGRRLFADPPALFCRRLQGSWQIPRNRAVA